MRLSLLIPVLLLAVPTNANAGVSSAQCAAVAEHVDTNIADIREQDRSLRTQMRDIETTPEVREKYAARLDATTKNATDELMRGVWPLVQMCIDASCQTITTQISEGRLPASARSSYSGLVAHINTTCR